MNQLARREVAIVSPHAGTTRDIIEVQLDLDGYPLTVIDTAGVRETDDPVELEGVRRAVARAAEADLVLWLSDAEHDNNTPRESKALVWLVRNKIDLDAVGSKILSRTATQACGVNGQGQGEPMFAISASRGDGLTELISALAGFAQEFFGATENALISRIRQRELLQQTAASLEHGLTVIGHGEELAAEDLRAAAYSLGRLLGRVDVEDILDVIFREFCIGK
jgi:tRNA modification GTPase